MKIYYGFKDKNLKARPRAVAIGIFDGVHRGHQKILKKMLREAACRKLSPTVVTFDPHPAKILHPENRHPAILMSLAHRLRFFQKLGIAETLVVPFNKKFSKISHEKFLHDLLIRRLGLRALSIGYDFRFGRGGTGDTAFLKQESVKRGFVLAVIPAVQNGKETISSTRIRHLIESGDLKTASRMLGRPVSVYGTVVRGRGRGKSVGFPTANLDPHHETLPPDGVYAAWGELDGKKLKGVLHIGKRPTFRDAEKTLEVHFLNFQGNIYGKEIELAFVSKLRGTRRFGNAAALAAGIRKDIAAANAIFSNR